MSSVAAVVAVTAAAAAEVVGGCSVTGSVISAKG